MINLSKKWSGENLTNWTGGAAPGYRKTLGKRITVLWTEAPADEAGDEYVSSENNSDNENEFMSDFEELESAMETEQLPPKQTGYYEIEIGSDDDCIEDSSFVDESMECFQSNVYGFKIVSDNLDKNFRPRKERQTISKHYFHAYAVADRLNFSEVSDILPNNVEIDPAFLLVSDLDVIKKEFETLVVRYVLHKLRMCTRDTKRGAKRAFSLGPRV